MSVRVQPAIDPTQDLDDNVKGSVLGGVLDVRTQGQQGLAFDIRAFANSKRVKFLQVGIVRC